MMDKHAPKRRETPLDNNADFDPARGWRSQIRRGLGGWESVASFDDFDPTIQSTPKAIQEATRAKAAVEAWSHKIGPPLLTLAGGVGVGKTMLLKAAVMSTQFGYYLTAAQFDSRVKDFRDNTMFSGVTGDGYKVDPDVWLDRLGQADIFLVIDDIGAGYIDKGWTLSRFERLFDIRWTLRKPTAVSTNLSVPDFINAVGPRVWSRLRDSSESTVIGMPDSVDVRGLDRS